MDAGEISFSEMRMLFNLDDGETMETLIFRENLMILGFMIQL